MYYLGDFSAGATVRGMWNTNAIAGESITRATNGTLRIYKNGSTTERSSAAGITDTEDFDTQTGVHHFSIDLSDNTDAGFYAAGNDYFVVLNAATIDGKSINAALACFSIENRCQKADVVKHNGTAVATPNVAGVPLVDVGYWRGTQPNVLVSNRVDSSVGAMASGSLTATAIASAAFTNAKFATDTILMNIRSGTAQAGAAGSITLDSGASATDGMYADCLVQITSGTGSGQVRLITGYTGSSKVAAISPNWITNPASGSVFTILPTNRASVGAWLSTVPNSLQSGRLDSYTGAMASNVITSAATDATFITEIENSVLDATAASHNTAGTIGQKINAAGGASDPLTNAVPGAYAAGTAGYVLGTNLNAVLTTDVALPIVDLQADLTAVKAKTDALYLDVSGRTRLATDGLDAIGTAAPSGVASTFREMLVQLWRRSFRKATLTSTQMKTYADDGTTVLTTQAVSDDGTTQTQGAAS